jgi:uncharacterized membrane protein YphA (DoxX/SURF4 family)
MNKAVLVVRIVLGAIFTVFSMNYFFNFMPQPAMPEAAGAFMGALMATGYLLPLLKVFELISGIMLLAGFMVPLALTMLAPIIINIAAFHLVLAPGGLAIGLLLLVMEGFLAWAYRDAFTRVLQPRARPVGEGS